MGLKSFSFIVLTIFGTGHTLATFQQSGKISLSIDDFIIWTIGKSISSATDLRNFTGILWKPTEQSLLNSDNYNLLYFSICCTLYDKGIVFF